MCGTNNRTPVLTSPRSVYGTPTCKCVILVIVCQCLYLSDDDDDIGVPAVLRRFSSLLKRLPVAPKIQQLVCVCMCLICAVVQILIMMHNISLFSTWCFFLPSFSSQWNRFSLELELELVSAQIIQLLLYLYLLVLRARPNVIFSPHFFVFLVVEVKARVQNRI